MQSGCVRKVRAFCLNPSVRSHPVTSSSVGNRVGKAAPVQRIGPLGMVPSIFAARAYQTPFVLKLVLLVGRLLRKCPLGSPHLQRANAMQCDSAHNGLTRNTSHCDHRCALEGQPPRRGQILSRYTITWSLSKFSRGLGVPSTIFRPCCVRPDLPRVG